MNLFIFNIQVSELYILFLKVAYAKPETRWATHGQDERYVKITGGPNASMLQNTAMNCE